MIYEVSENVTYVNNTHIDAALDVRCVDRQFISTKRYKNNICVIDTNLFSGRHGNILTAFKTYHDEGHLYPVTRSGLPLTGHTSEIGSIRFCTMNSILSDTLHKIIMLSDAFPTFYSENDEWFKLHGVSPYFRFMRYHKGGMHYPHYDSDYEYSVPNTNIVTKFSLVVYMTDNNSGALSFVDPTVNNKPLDSDWDHQASDDEIYLKVLPKVGRIVLFPHTICHTVLELEDTEPRIMARGDVEFIRGAK